jgi:chlorite dismutase
VPCPECETFRRERDEALAEAATWLEHKEMAERERNSARVALTKLANEVDGILSISRHAMRETAGNTNVECLELRLREAREALEQPK